MSGQRAIVLLTGSPGVGKTTIVEKICKILKEKNIHHRGFFTKEIRVGGKREGFQVISVDGKVGTLAHIRTNSSKKVGAYGVDVESFESVALAEFEHLEEEKGSQILIIDEIGKMEMFSEKFKTAVKKTLESQSLSILATIPISKSIPFVEEIRPHGKLLQIDRNNRDFIIKDILSMLKIETL